jgi:caa(3)-type oxidase subunit IV
MATGPATETTERADTHAAAHGHDHPSDGDYIKIAAILAVFTALETATYFIEWFEGNATRQWLVLGPLMTIKFAMVAWFFMHLKQDSRLFSRLFVSGIMLAVGVYVIVLLAFDQFF